MFKNIQYSFTFEVYLLVQEDSSFFKYIMHINVRFIRLSASGDAQSAVGTFYCYAKVASYATDLNL